MLDNVAKQRQAPQKLHTMQESGHHCTMDVFISWSGPQSKQVAETLHHYLPLMINAIQPWLSSADIDAGARWASDIAGKLQQSKVGIICLTPTRCPTPHLASYLLYTPHISEIAMRCLPSIDRSLATLHEQVLFLLKMKPDLFVQLAPPLLGRQTPGKKKSQPAQPFPHHDPTPGIGPRTSPIADVSRSHVSSSVSNCFLPAGVSA